MNFDELFKNIEEEEPLKMTITDFVNKTRMILTKIDKEIGESYKWRRATENEYNQQDCDNCKGDCVMLKNSIELHRAQNKEEGDCFVLEIQYQDFLEEVEKLMYHEENVFYDLLNCEVVSEENL